MTNEAPESTQEAPESAVPAEGESAPEQQPRASGAPVDGDPAQHGSEEADPQKVIASLGVKNSKLKSRVKQTETRLQQALAELEALKKRTPQKPEPEGAPRGSGKSLFDDPDGVLTERETRLKSEFEQTLERKLAEREAIQRRQADAAEAEKWLLSREDLQQDPEAEEAIESILAEDPEIKAVARVAPKRAALLAFNQWRESKGLPPVTWADQRRPSGRGPDRKPAGSGGPAGGGKKIWTVKELEDYASKLNPADPDFDKKYAEVVQAQVEGRIKK